MMNNNDAPLQLNRLYEEFFERGLQYFFPFATFHRLGAAPPGPTETVEGNAATAAAAPWLGAHYALHNPVPFTALICGCSTRARGAHRALSHAARC